MSQKTPEKEEKPRHSPTVSFSDRFVHFGTADITNVERKKGREKSEREPAACEGGLNN